VENKTVLLRVDYNVPLKDNKIQDDNRIKLSLPTLKYLIHEKAKIIILTHVGRPNGKPDKNLSVKPIAKYLKKLTHQKISILNFPITKDSIDMTNNLKPGQIIILENTRFNPQEKTNRENYSKRLASLGDLIIFDAFASFRTDPVKSVVALNVYLNLSEKKTTLDDELRFLLINLEQEFN